MPAGVISWIGSKDPEVQAARYAIAIGLAQVAPEYFADIFNARKTNDEEPLTPLGQEYRVVRVDTESYNCDDMTLTITMSPGPHEAHVKRAGWYKQQLMARLVAWLRVHAMFAKAEIGTLQVDLRFMPMSGCVVKLSDGRVTASWGDASWQAPDASTAP